MVPNEELASVVTAQQEFRVAIDPSVGGENVSELEKCLEHMLLWAYQKVGSETLVQAKEEFYERTGKIFPDDDFFNDRMSYFIDQFVFERPLGLNDDDPGQTIFEAYLKQNEANTPIQGFIHSIFSIHRINDKLLTLRDLFTNERHKITRTEEANFQGIGKKDIFQGFIYQLESHKTLSRGLVFHPHTSHSIIKKHLKSLQKQGTFETHPILSDLAMQQLRHLRHGHVHPKLFYQKNLR